MPDPRDTCLLTASDLSLRFNDRVVLDGATLAVGERDRLGLVGLNGAGKSTFLKILAGELEPDSGTMTRRRDMLVGYLAQSITPNPDRTVQEFIRSGAQHILDLIAQFESLPALSARHEELERLIQLHDGWGLDHRLAVAMAKLGCPDPLRLLATLSGGELRRAALCRAIIAQPDLLILDEPTNHLDAESIEWLGEFLGNYPGAFLLVTHDRRFLDDITSGIVELAQGKFYSYAGNYTEYLLAKAARVSAAETLEHKRQMFLRKELDWVRRGPSAQRTKSKVRLERFYEIAGAQPDPIDREIELVIPPPAPLGNKILKLANVGVAWDQRWLFRNVHLNFEAGQRLGIIGRNGLGKTTLLKVMLGQLEPTEGKVTVGQLTRFNYVDQGRLQLNEEHSVLEEMSDGTEFVLFGTQRLSLRAYLKRFQFTDDRISTQVKFLSGGERSRLLLARILKAGGNFILLDEPTNDLDLPTLRVLEEALAGFPGVVVVVSHDRYFLNRVCTAILALEGQGRVTHTLGGYDDYALCKRRLPPGPVPAATPASAPASRSQRAPEHSAQLIPTPERPQRFTFKDKLELESMEQSILQAENEVSRLELLFADPDFHRKYGQQTQDLTRQLEEAKACVARLYARWEVLEARRATVQAAKSSGQS